MNVEQIDAHGLKNWLDNNAKEQPVLIDVREPWEFEICHIANSTLIPMKTMPSRYTELNKNSPHVIVCHHGNRSQQVALFLANKGFTNIYNLQGGVDAWAQEIEPAMAKY